MRRLTLALALVCLALSACGCPKNCRKGKCCGNSCISKSDTCHKDADGNEVVLPGQSLPDDEIEDGE